MDRVKFSRRKLLLAVAMLPFLFLSVQAFGQSASLSGTVTDASQAVLPGATITATNTDTGVKTTITTNNAGVYNMALQPGTYGVSAEMPGFQTNTKTDVTLGVAAALRLNFELQVSGVATQIEVSTSAADLLLESSSSTGTVMNEKVVKELPLLGNDMMQLINVMGGVVKAENTVFGNSNQTFAGVMANDINITRDGISVNDVRFSSGIVSPGRLNPEMVGEFKLVLTPVDAEMGRGAGQVQVLTKSGGNEFHGSGVWSVLNTALDAHEWDDNRTGSVPDWKNVNQYTISVGGPIIKNKTFFFATWDHNISAERREVTPRVLTPCARKGIYRYFPGWIPGNLNTSLSRSTNAQTRPSVNEDGTPLTPDDYVDGTPYADSLAWGSVLGQLSSEAQDQIAADPINCSQFNFGLGNTGVVPGTNWDPYREGYDSTGFIDRFTGIMPLPNYYYSGDGLNVAAYKWTRTTHGTDTVYGSGLDSARKAITIKIDHNINTEHRFSGTYSYESSFSATAEAIWPEPYGFGGSLDRKPQTFTATLTSTLRPTLLNELRFGLAYNASHNQSPLDNSSTGQDLADLLQTLLPTDNFSQWSGLPVYIFPGSGTFLFEPGQGTNSHPIGGRLPVAATWGSNDYRWTFTDTLTWTKGSHSLKFGGDIRLTKANSDLNGASGFTDTSAQWHPVVVGGNSSGGYSQPTGLSAGAAFWPGMVGNDSGSNSTGTYSAIYNMMNYMAGTFGVIHQYYFVNDPFANTWSDPSTPSGQSRLLHMNQNEYAFFFKDDWKVNSDLTLNLGMRYEYYGVPHMLNGMTIGLVGGAESLFGGQEGGFQEWLQGVPNFNPDNLTAQHFIGPDSPNPDQEFFKKDLNNWGPAVGFAWQLPWFGRGKTTLRGGYQLTYSNISRMDPNAGFMNVAGSQPGTVYTHDYGGDSDNYPYMDLSMLPDLVPTSRFWNEYTPQPLAIRPVTDGTQTVSVYDPNIRSPYIQSLTLALTRQIGSSLTVDVRYIGTLSRKQISSMDLNEANWVNNGLKEALDIARAGGESDLLNEMIPPYSLWYASSGAEQLRTYYMTKTYLAIGDYETLANVLGTENGLISTPSGVQGNLLRSSGFPENFIYTNPQFSAANWYTNLDHTNYHSLQGQVTLRPTHGLNFQASYTWSRNLGTGGAVTDPLNRALDYGILSNHRSHMLTTYGTYNLPLGPDGYLFRDISGWAKKLVEGWQLSWISSLTSGLPASVSATYSGNEIPSLYGGAYVDLVQPDLFDTKGGHVTWEPGSREGRFYGDMYVQVDDPQCDNVASGLVSACRTNLNALALASDPSVIVLQHALPGERGNFYPNQIMGPGRWGLDLAMSKNIEFMEGKSINFRVDVNNIFNHPTPSGGAASTYNSRDYWFSNPTFDLNSSNPFGYLGYKGGHRVFSAKVRITF